MKYIQRYLIFILLISLTGGFFSCVSTKKVVYFDNIQDTVINSAAYTEPVIQKNDLLNINVSSLNPQASAIFNQQGMTTSPSSMTTMPQGMSSTLTPTGAPTATMGASTGPMASYLVAQDDSIKFPILGNIRAGGLTKKQLETEITQLLIDKKMLVDPIITVRFLNFRVTVLGEVARPSTINVTNDRISVLEALGLAGDLTIFAKRENVLLIREEGNTKVIRRLDLNSKTMLTSPYYYLKTNDIVYVEPNRSKVAAASRSTTLLPIILSAMSFIAIIVSYIIFKN